MRTLKWCCAGHVFYRKHGDSEGVLGARGTFRKISDNHLKLFIKNLSNEILRKILRENFPLFQVHESSMLLFQGKYFCAMIYVSLNFSGT